MAAVKALGRRAHAVVRYRLRDVEIIKNELAVELIRLGKAYVDSLSADELRAYRGTLTEPGRNSPFRDRSARQRSHSARRVGR